MTTADSIMLDCPSLQSYLTNKISYDPCEFHTTRPNIAEYPALWANPRILCKTKQQDVIRKGQIPKQVLDIIYKSKT